MPAGILSIYQFLCKKIFFAVQKSYWVQGPLRATLSFSSFLFKSMQSKAINRSIDGSIAKPHSQQLQIYLPTMPSIEEITAAQQRDATADALMEEALIRAQPSQAVTTITAPFQAEPPAMGNLFAQA